VRWASTGVASTTREQILEKILEKVPSVGFEEATQRTLNELGYSGAARNLFPSGPFDIVKYHLQREKAKLVDVPLAENATVYDKVYTLICARLLANESSLGHRLSDTLSIITSGSNIKESLAELHSLSDEIWFLASDRSTDMSWYTRRAAVSSIYASAGMFLIYQVQ
jgi:ubiquinone biosynthesis protein COQ9